MNITLLAINSKYIHSSLALWYLTAACKPCGDLTPLEHSMNEPLFHILHSVYETEPDVLVVSCYIWNIGYVLRLCGEIKALLPQLTIILGGPEASFRAQELMREHPEIDLILLGEGEESLPAVLRDLPHAHAVSGCVARKGEEITQNGGYQCIAELDALPSPYTDQMLASLHGKLAYYESSRGCPFSCAYCLSCATKGVRTFSLNRVFSDLRRLSKSGVQTIKFVDRTFNADRGRAKEIVSFLLALDAPVTYHFEVGADLFDEELLDLLHRAPPGRFQIEAGIQSTNEPTLRAVCRVTDTAKALDTIREIASWNTVHVHADLICGLPYESFSIFARSFDELYAARPHALQLGFLKLLHGSALRKDAAQYGYIASPEAPYELRASDALSASELFRIHEIEDAVEKYYNSGRFCATLAYITTRVPSAFALFSDLADKMKEGAARYAARSPDCLFQLLADFCRAHPAIDPKRADAALAFDYYSSCPTRFLPPFLNEPLDAFDRALDFDCFAQLELPVKELAKRFLVKAFPYDMESAELPARKTLFAFSRREKDPVTQRFSVKKLPE